MWILDAAVFGLVVGAIARLIVPGKHPRGLLVTIVVGVAGSVIATWAGHSAGYYNRGTSAGYIASIVGAVVLLLGLQALTASGDRR